MPRSPRSACTASRRSTCTTKVWKVLHSMSRQGDTNTEAGSAQDGTGLAAVGLPQPDGAVAAGRGEAAAVGREGAGHHPAGMSGQHREAGGFGRRLISTTPNVSPAAKCSVASIVPEPGILTMAASA